MNPTDDDAAERARLERIAWGAGSSPTDAARARIALADLPRRRRQQARPGSSSSAAEPAPGRSTHGDTDPADGRRAATEAVPSQSPGSAGSLAGSAGGAAVRDAVEDGTSGPEAARRSGAADGQRGTDDRSGTDASVGPADDTSGASVPAGRVSGLLTGARGLAARVRRADRTALWVAAGVAVVVGLAVGTGAGVAVGTGQSAQPGTAVVTPTAGTVTVEQLLAAPQTYADQLPGAVDAPVMLRTTRLVFTNRSLSGDDAATPWAVWAGVGRDGKMICLVASADRLQGSSACYPREDALHGTVSMTAMSSSGTLWVSLKGGAVLATVTGSY
jgi:hypothetical protein